MIMEKKKRKKQEPKPYGDKAPVGPFHYVPEGMKTWHDTLEFVFQNSTI